MLNRLPLEINKRPARVKQILIGETLQTWVTWHEEDLPGILWTHARLKYGKHFVWWQLEITLGLSPEKINQLSVGLKRRAYFAGLNADTFDVFPTKKEGIFFSWLADVDRELIDKRKRQRRKRVRIPQNAEGRPEATINAAPLPEIEITLPYDASYVSPSRKW